MIKEKQTISKQLAKCPFCDIPLKLVGSKQRGNQHYLHEYNNNCILNGFGFIATDENIQHWNTRKPMQNIVERLEETKTKSYVTGITSNPYEFGACHAMNDAIKIVKEEGEINDNT